MVPMRLSAIKSIVDDFESSHQIRFFQPLAEDYSIYCKFKKLYDDFVKCDPDPHRELNRDELTRVSQMLSMVSVGQLYMNRGHMIGAVYVQTSSVRLSRLTIQVAELKRLLGTSHHIGYRHD
jgi:hypothetical protein